MPTKKNTAEVVDLGTVSAETVIGTTEEQQKVLQLATILPNVSCHIDRKVNMGNYESLGIGCTVYMPIGMTSYQLETYQEMASASLSNAYKLAADEINDRVRKIKAKMRGEEAGA